MSHMWIQPINTCLPTRTVHEIGTQERGKKEGEGERMGEEEEGERRRRRKEGEEEN